MNLSRIWFFTQFFIYFFISESVDAQTHAESQKIYLSGKDAASAKYWDFMVSSGRNSGEWTKIPVPSNWEMHGFGSFLYDHKSNKSRQSTAIETGFYRHVFYAESSWKKREVILVFDGGMLNIEVKVNGESVQPNRGNSSWQRSYDISDLLDYGSDNSLEVKVSKTLSSRNYPEIHPILGGIYAPVYLEILPENHFVEISMDARSGGEFKAVLSVNSVLKNAQIQFELRDLNSGESIGLVTKDLQNDTVMLSRIFQNIKDWNPEEPTLYEAVFSLISRGKKVHSETARVGFRSVKLSDSNGLLVNGKNIVLNGVNYSASYPTTGYSLSEANYKEDIQLIKQMHMNAVRTPYPTDRFLELADSIGLLVLVETKGSFSEIDEERTSNHPSLIPPSVASTFLSTLTPSSEIDSLGLKEFWEMKIEDPSFTGIFLKNFADIALIRDDQGGDLKFTEGDNSAGILGPYREKKADYFATREIWSPIQVSDFDPATSFTGEIVVSNHFQFSDLSHSRIAWSIDRIAAWDSTLTLVSKTLELPYLQPGESKKFDLNLPSEWRQGNVLHIAAIDNKGDTLYSWSESMQKPKEGNNRYFRSRESPANGHITVRESTTDFHIAVAEKLFVFGKEKGNLQWVKVGRELVDFSQNPLSSDSTFNRRDVTWKRQKDGTIQIKSTSGSTSNMFTWTVFSTGELLLQAQGSKYSMDYTRMSFVLATNNLQVLKWIGKGPYPMINNRTQGTEFGVWENNSMSKNGLNFQIFSNDNSTLLFSDMHALLLQMGDSKVEIRTDTPELYLGVSRQELTGQNLNKSDQSFKLSLLTGIPSFPIREKKYTAERQSVPHDETSIPLVLWFRFD